MMITHWIACFVIFVQGKQVIVKCNIIVTKYSYSVQSLFERLHSGEDSKHNIVKINTFTKCDDNGCPVYL